MPEADSDLSASTARFQAFQDHSGGDLPPSWQMKAPARKIGLLAVIVLVAAVLAAALGTLLIG